jgi:3-keto-5-aminohexanoate cleavage enzyme
MDKKVILALAPVGGWGKGRNNPITPEEIAEQVIQCAQAGASLVHLHARDEDGQLTTDISYFSRTTKLIREKSSIIIEASTGGLSSLTTQERALPLQDKYAENGSLNMGSLNFMDQVYINRVRDIKFWIQKMNQYQVKPCMEIFDTSHIRIAHLAIQDNLVKPPYQFNFIFDYQWGMAFSLPLLQVLVGMLPENSKWGVVFGNNQDFKNHLKSILWGATMIRVGFEDSLICNHQKASHNLILVQKIREEIESLNYDLASPEEARKILNLLD